MKMLDVKREQTEAIDMLELMNPIGLELGAARRREVAQSTMRDARASQDRPRSEASSALMIVSEKMGGPETAPRPTTMQATSDCG
jgi:hypothetical protein